MQQAKANYYKCISIAQMHMYKDNYVKGTQKTNQRTNWYRSVHSTMQMAHANCKQEHEGLNI